MMCEQRRRKGQQNRSKKRQQYMPLHVTSPEDNFHPDPRNVSSGLDICQTNILARKTLRRGRTPPNDNANHLFCSSCISDRCYAPFCPTVTKDTGPKTCVDCTAHALGTSRSAGHLG